ncbi:hypothetical protein DFP72DRAFT_990649 [Ephemerocybe angulata]|uniref:Uncharacterized protein n=1 Tax=Ephemerocybe angulata TaxID=980116 RepID=A0A8H6HXN8_9AGAR|nr:hypothetical protein DFP72DRAFT_990649 [Tulosesus angulatus]
MTAGSQVPPRSTTRAPQSPQCRCFNSVDRIQFARETWGQMFLQGRHGRQAHRGNQLGYNTCNGTTEGQTSLCQTSYFNSIDVFCLWAPPECGKDPGHGTRLIPVGALKRVQWMKTPGYVQARGNPMGGVIYSNAYNNCYEQVVEWHNFIGGNAFCLKACDPNGPNAKHFCEHVFDRIGCEGENQDFPGTYTVDGQVRTYTQPPESLGAISTMPYTARVPASSNCVTQTSSVIYAALPTVSAAGASSTTTTKASTSGTTSRTTTSGGAAATGGSSTAGNGADAVAVSG